MQVKKYEASTVIEALQQVKQELGPDAIVLSTQETRKGVAGKKFVVVAAVSEYQLKKKQLAEKQLGDIFDKKVSSQPASQQKTFIENVYKGAEKKYNTKNKRITQTQYIQIEDGESIDASADPVIQPTIVQQQVDTQTPASGVARVRQAAHEAFRSSLTSDFFGSEKKSEQKKPTNKASRNNAEVQLSESMQRMINSLNAVGIQNEIVQGLKKQALKELGKQSDRKALVDSWFAKWILDHTSVTGDLNEQLEIFVGPHGTGKTTSLVKAATHYVVNQNKKVALVTTDLNRVGAVEQLRVYSRILNAPVFVAKDINQLQQQLGDLRNFDKILVDTPGVSLSNIAELDMMRAMSRIQQQGGCRVHLVISALSKEKDLGVILKAFRVAEFSDIIVNNLDQTTQHGILINIQNKADKAFHSFGISSDVVDGFELASRERVLDLIFKLTKKSGERGHDSRI